MATKTCDLSCSEENCKIADELAGGGYSREQLVDMLNQEGVQTSEALLNAYNSSDVMQRAVELGKQGELARPKFETEDFIGEGQFGRVSQLTSWLCNQRMAPLVEWGGYQDAGSDPSGTRQLDWSNL